MARITYIKGSRDLRKNRRALRPAIDVLVAGETFQTANWSLGGLLLPMGEAAAGLQPGSPVRGTLSIGSRADLKPVDFTAAVVRVEDNGQVGLMFEGIDEPLFDFFDRCLRR